MRYFRGLPLAVLSLLGCSSISDEFGRPKDPEGPLSSPSERRPSTGPDTRPVVSALKAPPPISGGTLLVSSALPLAVAADPDRDRVSIVSLQNSTVVATIALQPGDEPGRVAEDGAQRVHVALRRGGAVVTIDLNTLRVTARRPVCGAPRGLAYDKARDQIHVACAGGELVSLPAAGGDPVRRVVLDVDLRDVIVRPDGGLFVTRFKSGDVLAVDAGGGMTFRSKLRPIERNSTLGGFQGPATVGPEPLEPAVAWRTLVSPTTGHLLMLHQYGLASTIKLDPPKGSPPSSTTPQPPSSQGSESYGTPPDGCGGLVQPAITDISSDGASASMGLPISAPVLTVDAAISPDAAWMVLAHAGPHDPDAPAGPNDLAPSRPTGSGQLTLMPSSGGLTLPAGAPASPASCIMTSPMTVAGQTTSVAFNPSSPGPGGLPWLVVQTREPAALFLFDKDVVNGGGRDARSVPLGGDSVFDTGHELFHRDAGGGIACASCHAEGAEDGRVWRFDPLGERRTQALHVGLKGTEPFHWDGDMKNFGVLVDEVMVRRMGGPDESEPRKDALQNWLFSLKPPASIVAAEDPAALRGKVLFESAAVGCATCHAGATLTSNQNVYVGTTEQGHLMQVPSLHGIAYRAPFLHNGCAVTLKDRFDPGCGGGDTHGRTSGLTDTDVSDLIAYLGSL